MNPIDAVAEWLGAQVGFETFKLYRGPWKDDPTNAASRLAALVADGGRAPEQDLDFDIIDIYLLTAQKGLSDSKALGDFAYAIRDRLKADWAICGVVQFRLLGGIVGPKLTEQDRYWYRLTMQVTQ